MSEDSALRKLGYPRYLPNKGCTMIEFSQSDLFYNSRKLSHRDTASDYVAMGYSPGTAAQLAHLSEYLLRDIGMDEGSPSKD